jgi:glycosyltransferase involved in cell wall biosynthesis
MRRLNILAIAYACSPLRGSEFGVGWGWANAIAESHNVTVITADFNAGEIDQHLAARTETPTGNLRFVYVKNRPWHYRPCGLWLKIENSLAKPLMNVVYQDWLGYAFDAAKQEIEQNSYDLVHLITYVGWRFSGRFYQLCIPFVWGPIGGLQNTPWCLFPALDRRGAIYYGGRNIINSFQIRFLQGPRRALRKAEGAVIAATSEIKDSLQKYFDVSSQVICEVGIPDIGTVESKRRQPNESLRICWSGLHLPGKALHLLLLAAARLPRNMNFSLHILGDGPSNRKWRALATRLGIDSHCHWYGLLPRNEALDVMKTCHVFAITSLKELTSTVAVEGISLGLPVICLDHCGFADLVTEQCGIKIPIQSIKQIESDFAEALMSIYNDDELRYRLAQGAIVRKRLYSWQSKMIALDAIYRTALSGNVLVDVAEQTSRIELVSKNDPASAKYV